jgi:spermidine/putrescine transport system ATP-binding protein
MTMSDRIAVMRAGKVEQLGTPEDLYERPATEFVAGFLGISNLLEGRVEQSDNGVAQVTLAGGTQIRVSSKAGQCVPGQTVVIGVRPEKLRISAATSAASSDTNTLEGSVVDASYVGVSTQYTVRVGDSHEITAYAQNVETSGLSEQLSAGERVRLTWKPQHTFVIQRRAAPTAEAEASAQEE